MSRLRNLFDGRYAVLAGNVAARIGALVSLTLATLLVARTGGPALVGMFVLLRVLPSLVGVVASLGLPGAVAYFLAGPTRDNRRLPATLLAIASIGGTVGALLWTACASALQTFLFSGLGPSLVMVAGALVLTRVLVATAKSCSQGSSDLPGANRVILTEELMFLPAYGLLWTGGLGGGTLIVVALLVADLATLSLAWGRLIRRGFFKAAGRPAFDLARRVASYGMRAQLGGVILLLNLRLDFILLTLLTGPAVLGVYAIASKFAELIKVIGMSLTYVLYPRYARDGAAAAAVHVRSIIPKAGGLTAAAVVPLWIAAPFVIPALYGSDFRAAVIPAQIILLGLALDGIGAVITAFLYGIGRPGLNSFAMAIGLAVTVVLDVILIPPFGANGAAAASAAAYFTSTVALVAFYRWVGSQTAGAPSRSRWLRI